MKKSQLNYIEPNEPQRRRVLFGIPMTGVLRSEWHLAFVGMVTPTNWSQSSLIHIFPNYSPLRFLVADARNLIAQEAIVKGYEWLIFIDHDVLPPADLLVKFNDYMIHKKKDVAIVGGLYFTRSVPAEPLIYRRPGDGYFANWKFGQKVWVSAMGLGLHLINVSILKILYDNSPPYKLQNNLEVRRIFESPSRIEIAEDGTLNKFAGTEDFPFYKRIIDEKVLEKAGYSKLQKQRYPFLCDTSIFSHHISESGIRYPSVGEENRFK